MSLLDTHPTSIRSAPPSQFLVLMIVSIMLFNVAWTKCILVFCCCWDCW